MVGCEPYHWPYDTDTGEELDLPDLELDKDFLEFEASLHDGIPVNDEFTVTNNLTRALKVWAAVDSDCEDQFEVVYPTDINGDCWVDPGQQVSVAVYFTPSEQQTCEGEVRVNWEYTVDLFGASLRPELSHSLFPDLQSQLGCETRGSFLLSNYRGSEPLRIMDVDTSGLSAFSLPEGVPDSIDEGEEAEIAVSFTPEQLGEVYEVLVLETNDPAAETLQVKLDGLGTDELGFTETFHYQAGDGVQVLLLVDDSDPDASWQDRIEDGLEGFVGILRERGIAYNIAGVSTEDACPGETAFATHNQALADAVEALTAALFDDQETPYADRLLVLTREALENTDPGDCLDGFVEAGQPLHVVLFSAQADAAEGDFEQVKRDIAALHGQASFSAVLPSVASSCGVKAQTYAEVAGLELDLCTSRWEDHWTLLADEISALESGPTSLVLAETAVEDTVRVSVEGLLLEDKDWDFDAAANEVELIRSQTDGALVEVRYTPASACP